MGRNPHFAEELCCLLRHCHHGYQIVVLQNKISVRDHNLSLSLHAADHNITLHFGNNIRDLKSIHMEFRIHPEFDRFHPSSCKCINLLGVRKTKQLGNLLSGRQLRIDNNRQAHLALDEVYFLAVNRISYSRDCLALSRLLRDQAAKKIQFV